VPALGPTAHARGAYSLVPRGRHADREPTEVGQPAPTLTGNSGRTGGGERVPALGPRGALERPSVPLGSEEMVDACAPTCSRGQQRSRPRAGVALRNDLGRYLHDVLAEDRPLRLLVSFSPEDRALKDHLVRHLEVLVRFGGIALWSADRI